MANPAVVQGSKDTLTKAILGFKGATAGSKEHEELNKHLERVFTDFKGGRKAEEDTSPGRREVGLAAHQREIPMERGHEGGGNVLSNEAHGHGLEFARHTEDPGEIAPSNRGEDRSVTKAAAVHTGGNLKGNIPSGPSAVMHGAVSFRTIAAKKAGDVMNEPGKTSGGNRKSVNPAPAAREPARVGEAPAPSKAGPNANPGAWEQVPQYVAKEQLGKDTYERAAEGVRKLLKAPRR